MNVKRMISILLITVLCLINIYPMTIFAENDVIQYDGYVYVSGQTNEKSGNVSLVLRNSKINDVKSSLVQIEQTKISEDGTYSFKFPFSPETGYEMADYNVTVNLAGKVINDTIKVCESIQTLVRTNCSISESGDGTVTATAQISKVFADAPNGKYNIKLILAFYGSKGELLSTALSTFDSVDVVSETMTKTVSATKPNGCVTVKAFAWESLNTAIPLSRPAKYYDYIYNILVGETV